MVGICKDFFFILEGVEFLVCGEVIIRYFILVVERVFFDVRREWVLFVFMFRI